MYTGGSERLRIDTSGNVGIGTSSPGQKLDVSGGFIRTSTNDRGLIVGSGNQAWYSGGDSGVGTGYLTLNVGSERMRIDSSGNVGIGTSSPVNATNQKSITIDATTTSRIDFRSGGTARFNLQASSTETTFANEGLTPFVYYTNGAERMRITSGGNLLVGTTSEFAKVTSRTTSSAAIPFWASSNYSGDLSNPAMRFDKFDNNTTTSQVFVNFSVDDNKVACGQINANGGGAAAFGSWSDRRLKQNIVDLPDQLENITALRPVEFDYIESEGGGHQIGFIAQEIQEVYPDAVGERVDGMLTVTGWSKTEARLVKAIQELKAELDSVKAELQTLKGV
jgi:trimeric autotransporter adhesin